MGKLSLLNLSGWHCFFDDAGRRYADGSTLAARVDFSSMAGFPIEKNNINKVKNNCFFGQLFFCTIFRLKDGRKWRQLHKMTRSISIKLPKIAYFWRWLSKKAEPKIKRAPKASAKLKGIFRKNTERKTAERGSSAPRVLVWVGRMYLMLSR